jgi:hypothetical protein
VSYHIQTLSLLTSHRSSILQVLAREGRKCW